MQQKFASTLWETIGFRDEFGGAVAAIGVVSRVPINAAEYIELLEKYKARFDLLLLESASYTFTHMFHDPYVVLVSLPLPSPLPLPLVIYALANTDGHNRT